MTKSLFLTEISDFMIARRYSKRTIETYFTWIRAYIKKIGHPTFRPRKPHLKMRLFYTLNLLGKLD